MRFAEHTILIVEDYEDDVFALTWALKKALVTNPLQVVIDGQQAMDYLAGVGKYSQRDAYPIPGFVFLDLKLPYRSGFEVLTWVREHPEFADLPVVILTGSDEGRDHGQAESLGVAGYLVKPATPSDLRAVVDTLQAASV